MGGVGIPNPGIEPANLASPALQADSLQSEPPVKTFLVCAKSLQSCPTLWTLWTVSCQAPLSIGFSRQEYWSGLPCPPPWDLLSQGFNLHLFCLLHWQAGSLPRVPPYSQGPIQTFSVLFPLDWGIHFFSHRQQRPRFLFHMLLPPK